MMANASGAVPVRVLQFNDDCRYEPSEIDDFSFNVGSQGRPSIGGTPIFDDALPCNDDDLDDCELETFVGQLTDKGHRLWAGSIADYDNDHSRADMGFCMILARATKGNKRRMDCLFRQSGLYRNPERQKKWNQRHAADKRTYGEMTIDKAVEHWRQGQTDGSLLDTKKKFPLDALPPAIRDLALEGASAYPVPVDAIAVPALVVAASAIGSTRNVEIKKGWKEPASLYAAVVMPSGSIKSPAQELALEPVREKQAEHERVYKNSLDHYEKELTEYHDAKKGERGPKPKPPILQRTFTTDTTTERCAVLLNENPRGILVARDELSALAKSFNQYKGGKGADKQFYLSCYSNVGICVDRQGKPPVLVTSPCLSIIGGIPPDVLSELNEDGREDGFVPRLLYAWPDSVPVRWTNETVSEGARNAYRRLIDTLYSLLKDDCGRPITLPLTPDALVIFIKFHDEHCAEAEDPNLPPGLRVFYAKLKGLCARLALIHAICSDPGARQVSAESVAAAADLIDYFKGQAARVMEVFRRSPRCSPLERAEREILRNLSGGVERTRRELQQLGNASAAVFNDAFDALVKVGRVRSVIKQGKRRTLEAYALVVTPEV